MSGPGGRRGRTRSVLAALVSVAGLVSLTPSNSAAGAQVHSYELVHSFGSGGLVDFDSSSTIRQLHALPDGSVLVVLDRYDTLGQYVSGIAKLRPDGTLDTTFAVTSSTPGILDVGTAYGSLVVRSDGHLLFGTRQYTASGEVDTLFGVDGYVAHLGVHLSVRLAAFVETGDHSLVMIAEGIEPNHCYIMSVSATGNLETPYPVLPASCHKAFPATMPDGSTVVVTQGQINYGVYIVVLDAAGNPDMSAGGGTGVAKASFSSGGYPVIGVVPNTQGKVVVLEYRGAGMSWVARFNSDGTIDPTFGSGEGLSFVGYASGISIDASGSVTIAVDGVTGLMSQAALIRLTPDGWLDGEFNPASAHQGLLGAQEYGVAGLSGAGPVTAYGDAGLVLSLRRPINSQSWHSSVALLRPVYSSTLPTPSPPIPPPPPTTRDYVPVVPVRMLETRATEGQVGFAGSKPGPGAIVELHVIGRGSPVVPGDASAVAFNLTGVNASGAGFVTVWPCGQPRPWASSLNLTLGDVRANLVISKVGDGGKVCLYTNAGTDLVADLNGWYPAVTSYVPVVPVRMLETRATEGQVGFAGSKPGPGAIVELHVIGRGSPVVPGDASAVAFNLTGVNASGAVGVESQSHAR